VYLEISGGRTWVGFTRNEARIPADHPGQEIPHLTQGVHKLTATSNGGTLQAFLNGVLVNSVTDTIPLPPGNPGFGLAVYGAPSPLGSEVRVTSFTAKPGAQLQVALACTPTTIIRAGTVSCNASWSPSTIPAAEILFDWQFNGDSVRLFPGATAQPYEPPPSIDTSGQGMNIWSGKMVLGGRVSLRATWSGQVDTTSAAVAVSSRTDPSFGNLPVSFASAMADIPTDLTVKLIHQPNPDGIGSQGVAGQNYDTRANSGLIQDVIHDSAVVTSVPSGPNRGLWYVTSPGVESTRGARIRTWLSGREPPQFRYTPVAGLLTNRGLLQARRKTLNNKKPMHPDSLVFLNGVWAHETYGQSGAKGHQLQIEVAAKSEPTCGKVPAILERLVAPDSGSAAFRIVNVIDEGKKSLYAAAGHNHVHSNYSNGPFYEVVPQTTLADNLPFLTAVGDMPGTADPSVAPDSRWNCSRVY
jgi:hypothetical protein